MQFSLALNVVLCVVISIFLFMGVVAVHNLIFYIIKEQRYKGPAV